MAGTIAFSLSQQFNDLGAPLAGGKLHFFEAGTTTPQSAYQDSGLTIAHPNPITLDSAGRVPQFFLADGSIKIRLDSSTGVTQVAADGILVIGASSGGGGGSPVDATTVLATGDIKWRHGTGVIDGFVRCNGRTVGSATSSATERANADTEALFLYLWGADSNLTVSGGRGADAAADWAANKNIAVPDVRGRIIAGMDDMGTSAASRLTSAQMTPGGTTLGATGGAQSVALSAAENGPHTHTGNTNSGGTHVHSVSGGTAGVTGGATFNAVTSFSDSSVNGQTGLGVPEGTHAHAFTTDSQGSGTAHANLQPTITMTCYIKM